MPGMPHCLPQHHFHDIGVGAKKSESAGTDKSDGRLGLRQLSPEHPRQQQYTGQFIL
jgi:hypothetical protein